MMLITIAIDYPGMDPQGIKEALAMDLEKYGRGVRVVEVKEIEERQVSLFEGSVKT